MKQVIIYVTIIAGMIGLMMWANSSNTAIPEDPNAEAALAVSETEYDFGTISMKDGDVTKEFTISNPSGGALFLPSLATSCMCTKAYLVRPDGTVRGPYGMPGMGYLPPLNETIEVGGSRVVKVVYDPNAHGPAGVGRINRVVSITEQSGGRTDLVIKALVTP